MKLFPEDASMSKKEVPAELKGFDVTGSVVYWETVTAPTPVALTTTVVWVVGSVLVTFPVDPVDVVELPDADAVVVLGGVGGVGDGGGGGEGGATPR